MLDKELEVTIGGLLHDIGKVVYREGKEVKTHSQSGFDFLKEEANITNKDILNCVKYHHANAISGAGLKDDDLAYIVYFADNIASSIDRRNKLEEENGFEIHTPLQPVFNILNKNNAEMYYSPEKYNVEKNINMPSSVKKVFSKEQYAEIVRNIKDNLLGIELSNEYINSLLEVMEANLSYVPSSTSKKEVPDISLFDHVKVTAAIAVSILHYMESKNECNYKSRLYTNGNEFYGEKAFLIGSIDLSGIQNFIYTIPSKNALKNLRARSFYLEILMEHIIDEILDKLGLSRANLLYVGGGHCYLLLPNTDETKTQYENYLSELNEWFIDKFDIDLFAAGAYAECSADDLKNIPRGSYENIFREISSKLSKKKMTRYSAKTILSLNSKLEEDYSKE